MAAMLLILDNDFLRHAADHNSRFCCYRNWTSQMLTITTAIFPKSPKKTDVWTAWHRLRHT